MALNLNFQGPRRRTVKDLVEGEHDFTSAPNESLYFVNCSNVTININSRCCKVSIENCKSVKVNIKYSLITSFCEVTNCDGVDVMLAEGVNVSTVSVDQSDNITIHVTNAKEQLEKIWWHKVDNVQVHRGEAGLVSLDKVPGKNKIQKFQHVCKPQDDGTFSKEPVMRENGYPITEQEKIHYQAIQDVFDKKMVDYVKQNIRIEKR